ncbi:hypothetical protein AQUCO_03500044v1 [Aquilegia coerulea]|uniref:Uncharacterized protein n=1 Tax=Aquilegia coerulea TaxID=218851 RepID=A0A2G5CVT9_AQUCA|nr:hypothetical protein AQUCO_03500044v1 [Aquilegia coerulea]
MGAIDLYFDSSLIFECGKKRIRSFFWRIRAEIKRRQVKNCSKKQRFSRFHYDPFSYSLNFDNGNSGFFC